MFFSKPSRIYKFRNKINYNFKKNLRNQKKHDPPSQLHNLQSNNWHRRIRSNQEQLCIGIQGQIGNKPTQNFSWCAAQVAFISAPRRQRDDVRRICTFEIIYFPASKKKETAYEKISKVGQLIDFFYLLPIQSYKRFYD